jgi:oxygen-independent coproporphyrinogen-3 oxidase
MMSHKELGRVEYLSSKYDETNMPTYISYPTTGYWKRQVSDEDFVRELARVTSPFLYFHFPFCKKACFYCACYKTVAADPSAWDGYISRLATEYNRKLDAAGIDQLMGITQMHWGGGTPTYMTPLQIERAFREIEKRAQLVKAESSSLSIEAYPAEDMIDRAKLKLLKDLGFTEISYGVQDFDRKTQAVINREYGPETMRRVIDAAREVGLRVHIDLCYGLPFQGLNEFEFTLREIVASKPNRVATYPYSHYPLLFPAQRMIPSASIPNSFTKVLLARTADEILSENGYAKIGFDHFVRKDDVMYEQFRGRRVQRDFMGYSVDQRKQLLGFGNSAISVLNDASFHNLGKMESYAASLAAGNLGLDPSLSHSLSEDDRVRKRVMLKSILTYGEIDKDEIEQEFGVDFDSYFAAELAKLGEMKRDGLIANGGSKIRLTKDGEFFSRHVAFVFDRYYGGAR